MWRTHCGQNSLFHRRRGSFRGTSSITGWTFSIGGTGIIPKYVGMINIRWENEACSDLIMMFSRKCNSRVHLRSRGWGTSFVWRYLYLQKNSRISGSSDWKKTGKVLIKLIWTNDWLLSDLDQSVHRVEADPVLGLVQPPDGAITRRVCGVSLQTYLDS